MSFSKKTIAAVLALSLSPVMSPVAHADDGEGAAAAIAVALILVSVSSGGASVCDSQQAEGLIDQAYAGNGEKLEVLAGASGKSVEAVADTIVRLEKDGEISAQDPKAMAETVATELAK